MKKNLLYISICICFLLFCGGCAKTVSLNSAQDTLKKEKQNRSGELMKAMNKPSEIVVQFTYHATDGRVEIIKLYDKNSAPSQVYVESQLKENLTLYEKSQKVSDFISIKENGEYACLYGKNGASNEMLSIFYESKNTADKGIVRTVLLPLALLSGDKPVFSEQVLSSERIKQFGRIIETRIMNDLDNQIDRFESADEMLEFTEKYSKHPRTPQIRQLAIQKLRMQNTFAAYERVFSLTGERRDAEEMRKSARTSDEKRTYAAAILAFAKDENGYFSSLFDFGIKMRQGLEAGTDSKMDGQLWIVRIRSSTQEISFISNIKSKQSEYLPYYPVAIEVRYKLSYYRHGSWGWMGTRYKVADTEVRRYVLKTPTSAINDEIKFEIDTAITGLGAEIRLDSDPELEVDVISVTPISQ